MPPKRPAPAPKKPVSKPVSKPTSKPAAKPAPKSAAKPAAKPTAKPAAKPAASPAATPASKGTAKPAPKKKPAPLDPKRDHRPQIADELGFDEDDERPLVVTPLTNLDNRINNPDDIEVDEAAISAGITHGGTLETRSQELRIRGSGGRKRSGARTKGAGRDRSKRR